MTDVSNLNPKFGSSIQLRLEPELDFATYARIPIKFEVKSILALSRPNGELGGFPLAEVPLSTPYWKDYDAIPGNHPTEWPRIFDVSHWGMLTASAGDKWVGGAVMAYRTPDLHLLEDRRDLAVIWDIRIAPEWRGKGIGGMIFESCVAWAEARECTLIKVETQNINVPACSFYASQGCLLGSINRFAYPSLPNEIQLIWYRKI